MSEAHRIQFLIERDGPEEAKQTILTYARTYRRAVLDNGHCGGKRHHASLPQYRRTFIESYLEFKRFALS